MGLNFAITADNGGFINSVNEVKQSIDSTQKILKGINAETLSFQEKITSLNHAIKGNNQVIARYTKDIGDFDKALKSAFESGDTDAINRITNDMLNAATQIKELTDETNKYREALALVESASGIGSPTTPEISAPKLFIDEEDYNRANQLREAIAQLKEDMANFSGSDKELLGLQDKLSGLSNELSSLEGKAMDAASSLGLELGIKAAETSESLYQLNNSIIAQKETISNLKDSVKNAADELQNLKDKNASFDELSVAQTKFDALSTSLSNAENQLRNLQAAQQDASTKWAQVNVEVNQHSSAMVKMLGGYDKYTAIISHLPAPLQGVIGGLNGMTGASKAFIATPIGAVIGALILALQALKTWFDSSAEGQLAFAEASGYVSGVLGQFKEIIIAVGKAIYSAFSDPKQAVSDLWDFIRQNLLNRLHAAENLFGHYGDLIRSIWDPDISVSDAIQNLADDWLQLGTGIENVTEKVSDFATHAHEAGKAMAEIAKENKQIDIDEHEWGKRRAEIDKIKAEAQTKIYDSSKSAQERKKAIAEFESALNEQYEMEREFADRRIAVQEEAMKWTTNSIEDNNKLADLQAQRLELDARQAQEIASLQRRKNSINTVENRAVAHAQKQLEAQQKLNETLEKLRDENLQSEISQMEDGQEKTLAVIEANYKVRLTAIEKQKHEIARANKKAGITGVDSDGLTEEQAQEINKAFRLNAANRAKLIEDEHRAELASYRDFIKAYGTFQQQKLAIAEEYAEKIARANNKWDAESLAKKRDSELKAVDVKAIEMQIDWKAVFGDAAGILESQLKETLSALKEYTKTDEFDDSSVEDKRLIYEAIERIQAQLPGNHEGTLDFGSIKNQMEDLGHALNRYHDAVRVETTAQASLSKAQTDYKNALASGDTALIEEAGMRLDLARTVADTASEAVTKATTDVENFGNRLRTISDSTAEGLGGLADGLQKFKSGSLVGVFDGVRQSLNGLSKLNLGDKVNSAVDKLSSSLSDAGPLAIIPAILGLLDVLKEGFGTLISSLIDTVLGAVDGIISNILSGRFVTQIGSSLRNGIGNILNTVTFGGFNSWISSSNAKEVNKVTERLTDSNERLRTSIDNLKERIGQTGGMKAVAVAQQAIEAQNRVNQQQQDILRTQMGYHGSHHSNAYYWNLSDEDYSEINRKLKDYASLYGEDATAVGSLDDILALTPEQMDYIRATLPDVWAEMLDQGKYDKSEYWEAYADEAGKLKEITDELKESLTQISFSGMKDDFIGNLMDMSKNAEDFAGTFTEYLMKAVLNARISDLLDDELDKFYNDWAEYSSDGLSESEINELYARWVELTSRGIQIRDEIASITGYGLDTIQERLTDISFDSVSSSFKSLLSNMESSTADFSDSFTDMLRNALVNGLMDSKYNSMLKEWYDEFARAMDDQSLSAAERDALRLSYEAIVKQGLADREAIDSIVGGASFSQKATAGGYETISQDTGTELNGRFSAFQDSNERIAQGVVESLVFVQQIAICSKEQSTALNSILLQHVKTNEYLDEVTKYTKAITAFGEKLDKIASNTSNL